jgi:UPF0755 protein
MRRERLPTIRRLWIFLGIIVVLLIAAGYEVHAWYDRNLAAVSDSLQTTTFTVSPGESLHRIATDLKQDDLIRNPEAFEAYVRLRRSYARIQAGTYVLMPSMSTPQIVGKFTRGDVSKTDVTIYPGKTIADIRQIFKQVGYSDSELDTAFKASTYPDEPVLAYLPSGAGLEGFLYPDTFQKTAATPAQAIIRQSLEEMQSHLTDDIVAGFKSQGLSVFQGVTLASIINQESGDPSSQPTIAQVFLSRLKQGMPLQSNVTADYASDMAGVARTVTISSPYNTYLHPGLPPGPIGNVTDSALKAVAHPSATNYLYFIAGDDGTIHFSATEAQHEQAIKQYCHNLCAQ